MRLFIAVELDAPVRAALAAAIDRLKRPGDDVRWVAPEELHLTLKFCGELPRFEALEACLGSEVKGMGAIDLEIAGLGSFPGQGGPSVVWAGVRGDLLPLAQACERAASAVGVEPEGRRFTAHVTLGRVKGPGDGKDLLTVIGAQAETLFGPNRVSEVVIYRSGGLPRYQAVARIPLRSSA